MMPPSHGIELFFSYSSVDRPLRDELERHLALLKRRGVITSWHDRQITAGSEWAGEIDAHLDSADVILLLVSADFLHSDYCYDVEMTRAMQRHEAGEARVIPVVLRAVEWQTAPFGKLQAAPAGGVAVTSWKNRDEAFADVVRAISTAIDELRGGRAHAHTSTPPPGSPAEFPDYFPGQRQLIDEHNSVMVGRGYVRQAIDRFIATQPRGYFIVEGGPGLGKTSIAAKLVADQKCAHHFVGRTGRRADIALIVSSLLAQLGGVRDPAVLRMTTLEDLTALYEDALRHRAARTAPCLVVIDALNELPARPSEGLPFLPVESLPVGAYIVVTAQPGAQIEGLLESLAAVPTQVYELGPLLPEEIRQLIVARQPDAPAAVIERINRASFGNPLYVRATLDAMAVGGNFDADTLPEVVEGYFRRATREAAASPLLRDALGFLAVSRQGLSLAELGQITGEKQRSIREQAIEPIRPFLRETDDGFVFYHERFHHFVLRELLFEDELPGYHGRLANWLLGVGRSSDQYWTSLAYHLHESADPLRMVTHIDEEFLTGKLRRAGYGVLEDLELLAETFLESGDIAAVEECVARVDRLRSVIGRDMIDELARSVQPHRHLRAGAASRMVVPRFGGLRDLEIYAVLLPRDHISADFVEVVNRNGSPVVAIGDAPLTGLKSAFVARFVATLFRSLARSAEIPDVCQILKRISESVSHHEYFERVSMQCVELSLEEGALQIVSAGHPYPVLYSPRYGRSDRLPVRGPLLHAPQRGSADLPSYQVRHAEVEAGSVIVLVSDGITDGGPLEKPYGYRFTSVLERCAHESAQAIASAILDDWRSYLGDQPQMDDATILVMVVTGRTSRGGAS